MTPVFSFVAYSNTGKTTYIEKLIAELAGRGVRVGALKHDAHEFEIDKPGKDSWRFGKAGAAVVAVASATKCAVMEYRPVGFSELIGRFKDVDLILVEGWHAKGERRIALWRSDSGNGLKLDPGECIAVVSDVPIETGATPLFPLGDVSPMADFLLGFVHKSEV
jgi:molybdopterin-guanine dinucleotide biosynthesis protein MobB